MEGWATQRRKRRESVEHEERLNRDGRWVRQFNARSEVWHIFEHWASEADFRLAAIKGQRRLYVQGAESRFYRRFLDIRVDGDNKVSLIAWIEVTFLARFLSGFTVPVEMTPEPKGLAGLRVRRRLCHDLNGLLERFKQAPIVGSTGFHVLDMDASSLALATAMAACAAAFLIPAVRAVEIRAGLSNGLLVALAREALILLGVAAPLLGLQAFFSERLVQLFRWVSSGLAFAIFLVVTIVMFTRTDGEMQQSKFAYYCLAHFSPTHCRDSIAKLPAKERDAYLARLRLVENELSFTYPRPKPQARPR